MRDTDEARSQQTQRLEQIALIKTLKGARYHRAALNAQRLDRRKVVTDSERLRQITVIGDQRETRIDDVAVGVENAVHDTLLFGEVLTLALFAHQLIVLVYSPTFSRMICNVW